MALERVGSLYRETGKTRSSVKSDHNPVATAIVGIVGGLFVLWAMGQVGDFLKNGPSWDRNNTEVRSTGR